MSFVVIVAGLIVLAALAVVVGALDRRAQATAWRNLGVAAQQNVLRARALGAGRDEGDLEMR